MINVFFLLLLCWRIFVFLEIDDEVKEVVDKKFSPDNTYHFFSTKSFAKAIDNSLFRFFAIFISVFSGRKNFLIFLFLTSFLFSTCSFDIGGLFDEISDSIEKCISPPPPPSVEYRYASQDLYLRKCQFADDSCPEITTINESDRVKVMDYIYKDNGGVWIQVEYKNEIGYCNANKRYWR